MNDERGTMCKWESLRAGWACPCGGFWVSAGASVGWSTDFVTDSRTGTDGRRAGGSGFDRLNPTASGWVGLSLRRVLGFGGHVRGVVNGLCHGLTDGNGWAARKWEALRGVGGLVHFDKLSATPGRILGFGGRVRVTTPSPTSGRDE